MEVAVIEGVWRHGRGVCGDGGGDGVGRGGGGDVVVEKISGICFRN